MLIICLYIDVLIFTGTDSVMFEEFKKSIMVEFEISDLRDALFCSHRSDAVN